MSKGGFKAFRGAAPTAAAYLLETTSARLDEYYSEGEDRSIQHVVLSDGGIEQGTLSSEEFKAWMEHRDPETGQQRGTFRQRMYVGEDGALKMGGTPLFQETLISSSKSLSLAAAADPRIAEALEAAQARAAVAGAVALKDHAVTRVGPKGGQYQVKLEQMEITSVQHKTSRAGDPHFHRHVQLVPKGLAEGKWRAIDGKTLYRLSGRVHAAADLSMSTDMELRAAIAQAGYTWIPGEGGGKIAEFEPLVDSFSTRRDQIEANRESQEAQWRAEHPGQEPGPKQLRAWDQLGWAQQRPQKSVKGQDASFDVEELGRGLGSVEGTNLDQILAGQRADQIDPEIIAMTALDDLSQQHSAWSTADMKAAIDRRIAQTYLLGDDGLEELRTAAAEAAMAQQHSFYDDGFVVEGNRHFTSHAVLATHEQLESRLDARAQRGGQDGEVNADRGAYNLSEEQIKAAQAITGSHSLVVVEGAAGAGKTSMLEAANEQLQADGRRMVVVSPTKRGALEAGAAIGAEGNSVHALLYRAGASIDEENGKWMLPQVWKAQPEATKLDANTVLVVDEAGMLDQETARVLHQYVDDAKLGTLVLTGDTKQLAAVGRGGYMAQAAKQSTSYADLTDVRRFRTPEGQLDTQYADASVELRQRRNVDEFYHLLEERGQVQIGTSDEVINRVAETVALESMAGEKSLAITATNATAQRVNHAVFERLSAAGAIDSSRVVEGMDGDSIAAGARVATRKNDRELQVANRQSFTVDHVTDDGRITVIDDQGRYQELNAQYVAENVQLAYCVTAHGSQGMTVDTAHTVLSDEMGAAGAYVGLTRGRTANVLHAVAADRDEAREQFASAMAREGADLGLHDALSQSLSEMDGLDLDAELSQPQQPQVLEPRARIVQDLSETDMDQAELIAVVREHFADGSVDVDFQLASYDDAAQGQKSLRLQAEKTGQHLSADEYDNLTIASGATTHEFEDSTLEEIGLQLDATGGNSTVVEGKHVLAVRGSIAQDSQGGYQVDLTSMKPSAQHELIEKDVLSRQRAAEDKSHKQASTAAPATPATETAPAKPMTPAMEKIKAMRARQAAQNKRIREREQSQSQSYGMGL